MLKKKDSGAGEVTIRVLSSYDKIAEVKPGRLFLKRLFAWSHALCAEFKALRIMSAINKAIISRVSCEYCCLWLS